MKKSKRRIAAFTSVVSLASGAAMVAPPALASGDELISGEIVGTPAAISSGGFAGSYYTVTNISKVKKVTHASKYYNGTISNAKATYSSKKQLTLTAGLTYSVGASTGATVDLIAVAAKLESNTRLDLAASGSKTSGSTLSISATTKPKKYLVVAAGNTQVTGKWKKNYCASGNSGVVVKASGTGKSHTIRETAAVQCDLSQPSGSLAGLAKSRSC